jgi:hypothetical protein
VKEKIRERELSQAVKLITRPDIAEFNKENLELLEKLHPARPDEPILTSNHVFLSLDTMKKVLKASCNARAADIYGWRPELYKPYIENRLFCRPATRKRVLVQP